MTGIKLRSLLQPKSELHVNANINILLTAYNRWYIVNILHVLIQEAEDYKYH